MCSPQSYPLRSQVHWIKIWPWTDGPDLLLTGAPKVNECPGWVVLLLFSREFNITYISKQIWYSSPGNDWFFILLLILQDIVTMYNVFICAVLILFNNLLWVSGMWRLLSSEETMVYILRFIKNCYKGHCYNKQYKILGCFLVNLSVCFLSMCLEERDAILWDSQGNSTYEQISMLRGKHWTVNPTLP